MISVIIPTYKNPNYLDLCLKSIIENQQTKHQIIVAVDGFIEQSQAVLDKYKGKIDVLDLGQNQGMQTAINLAAYNAKYDKLLIINDDNVFGRDWDLVEEQFKGEGTCLTINQVEPTGPGIFNFPVKDFGRTPQEFRYEEWLDEEVLYCAKEKITPDGGIFPFIISKKDFMIVNGFDTLYKSPFVCDWDFFLKLDLNGIKFSRTHKHHFYHFGSSATKNRSDGESFKATEGPASQTFLYKWGFWPQLFENNSHAPKGQIINGVKY